MNTYTYIPIIREYHVINTYTYMAIIREFHVIITYITDKMGLL